MQGQFCSLNCKRASTVCMGRGGQWDSSEDKYPPSAGIPLMSSDLIAQLSRTTSHVYPSPTLREYAIFACISSHMPSASRCSPRGPGSCYCYTIGRGWSGQTLNPPSDWRLLAGLALFEDPPRLFEGPLSRPYKLGDSHFAAFVTRPANRKTSTIDTLSPTAYEDGFQEAHGR